jgi:tetratricopeptide (TPR) repeat protein
VARSLINIGAINHRHQRYDAARRAYSRAQEIFEESLRSDHPELAVLHTNLAHVDRETGRYEDAIASYGRAVELVEKARGPSHVDLANPLSGRGYTQFLAGRPAAGLPDLQRAIALLEAAAVDLDTLARTRQNLAEVQWALGERTTAVATMERARVEGERMGEVGAPLVADAAQWIAEHPAGP